MIRVFTASKHPNERLIIREFISYNILYMYIKKVRYHENT